MKPRLRLSKLLAAAAHLAVYGLLGWGVISVLLTVFATGIGLIPVLGVGLLLVGLFALALAGIARFEDARVAGLLDVRIPARPMRQSERTDWMRVPQTLWFQLTDGRNWIGLLHFTIITALGGVLLAAVSLIAAMLRYLGAAVHGDPMLPVIGATVGGPIQFVLGALGIVAALAAAWGLAIAHLSISTAMLVPSREEELARTAVVASKRRDDAVSAAAIERTRIERDLHDGVQPRLVSVGMTLGMAKAKLESDPQAAALLIDEAHAATKVAVTELRQLARGIHPAVLEDRGLDAALSALAARSAVPVLLDVHLSKRCSQQAEAAMYFAVAECITNVAKHADANTCRVTILERPGGMLWARIEDDGHGGARRVPGGGIDGIAGRVSAAGGTLSLTSPDGGPTTIEVSLPCAS